MTTFIMLGIGVVLGVIAITYIVASIVGRRSRGYRRAIPAWQRHLPAALLAGAVACVALAVVQFRVVREAIQGSVILVVDASQSMDRTDVAPSRFDAAKAAVGTFLDSLPEGFPVGLVSFANEPAVVVTPSTDHGEIEAALPTLERGKGTVIGDGLNAGLDVLEADQAANGERPAAVVLLSDGRDTGSAVPPLIAADRATALGVPVYTVVLGEPGEGKGSADATLLRDMATRTGATSSTAITAAELDQVYDRIGSQLSTDLAIGGSGPLFVLLGALLAAAATALVLLSGKSRF